MALHKLSWQTKGSKRETF